MLTVQGVSSIPQSEAGLPGLPLDTLGVSACRCGGSAYAPMGGSALAGGIEGSLLMAMQLNTMEIMLSMMERMLGAGGQLQNSVAAVGGSSETGSAASSPAPVSGSAASSQGASTSGSLPANVNVDKIVAAIPSGHQRAAREHFPRILAECQKQGVNDKAQMAYILATTVHESGAGAHMEEFASGSAYEGRRDLGNSQSGDGVRFKGRGYVQITGRNNYSNWSRKLGIDLVGNPELAERPETAARILVQGMKEGSFTGKKLSDYLGNGKADFEGARRIVNGTDKASTFAATARAILAAMG